MMGIQTESFLCILTGSIYGGLQFFSSPVMVRVAKEVQCVCVCVCGGGGGGGRGGNMSILQFAEDLFAGGHV